MDENLCGLGYMYYVRYVSSLNKLFKNDRPVKGIKVFAVVSEHGDEDQVAEETQDGRDKEHEALQPPLQPLKQLHCY